MRELHKRYDEVQNSMTRREQSLQIAVVQLLKLALPDSAFYFAVRNEGRRSKVEGRTAKLMGLRPGMPDLIILWQGKTFAIELKEGRGVLSRTQRQCHGDMRAALWCPVAVCKSLDEVEAQLRDWGFPLTASVLPSGAVQRESA